MGRSEFYGHGLPGVDVGALKGTLVVVEGADGVGRSTHVALIKDWLESHGRAVLETGISRSALAGKGLRAAKDGHTLGGLTMNLFYATDFADELEHRIIPALRAGFVVLTDRYIYSLMARAAVRGADAQWVKGLYEFALKPQTVLYLRTTVDTLMTRVVQTAGFNYWESGMDLHLGDDMFDSFIEYQKRLRVEFDAMADEYGFHVVDASASIDDVFSQIRGVLDPLLSPCRVRRLSSTPPNAQQPGRSKRKTAARHGEQGAHLQLEQERAQRHHGGGEEQSKYKSNGGRAAHHHQLPPTDALR